MEDLANWRTGSEQIFFCSVRILILKRAPLGDTENIRSPTIRKVTWQYAAVLYADKRRVWITPRCFKLQRLIIGSIKSPLKTSTRQRDGGKRLLGDGLVRVINLLLGRKYTYEAVLLYEHMNEAVLSKQKCSQYHWLFLISYFIPSESSFAAIFSDPQ